MLPVIEYQPVLGPPYLLRHKDGSYVVPDDKRPLRKNETKRYLWVTAPPHNNNNNSSSSSGSSSSGGSARAGEGSETLSQSGSSLVSNGSTFPWRVVNAQNAYTGPRVHEYFQLAPDYNYVDYQPQSQPQPQLSMSTHPQRLPPLTHTAAATAVPDWCNDRLYSYGLSSQHRVTRAHPLPMSAVEARMHATFLEQEAERKYVYGMQPHPPLLPPFQSTQEAQQLRQEQARAAARAGVSVDRTAAGVLDAVLQNPYIPVYSSVLAPPKTYLTPLEYEKKAQMSDLQKLHPRQYIREQEKKFEV